MTHSLSTSRARPGSAERNYPEVGLNGQERIIDGAIIGKDKNAVAEEGSLESSVDLVMLSRLNVEDVEFRATQNG